VPTVPRGFLAISTLPRYVLLFIPLPGRCPPGPAASRSNPGGRLGQKETGGACAGTSPASVPWTRHSDPTQVKSASPQPEGPVSVTSRGRTPEVRRALVRGARVARARPTTAERNLWDRLRARRLDGVKFRQKAPVLGGIIDFWSPERQVAVMISSDPANLSISELLRDDRLDAVGIRTVRIPESLGVENPTTAIELIRRNLEANDR
jgi:very-short-patch-repair endonuclease